MLLQSSQLANGRIMSLHTGTAIAQLGEPVLDPHKLVVEAFFVHDRRQRNQQLVLLTQDVREAAPGRVLIDSSDELTAPNQLIRLKELLQIKFQLIGKPVRTLSKQRLGKVEEYIIDTLNFEIQKLYVKQPIIKSFAAQTLVIDRTQIIEVSDRQVTVEDAVVGRPVPLPQQAI